MKKLNCIFDCHTYLKTALFLFLYPLFYLQKGKINNLVIIVIVDIYVIAINNINNYIMFYISHVLYQDLRVFLLNVHIKSI